MQFVPYHTPQCIFVFLAEIAALYLTMSVGRSDGLSVGWSVSTSFKVGSNTLEMGGTVIPMNFISKEVYALNEMHRI